MTEVVDSVPFLDLASVNGALHARLRARMEDGAPARAVRRWPRGRTVRGELCCLLRDHRMCRGRERHGRAGTDPRRLGDRTGRRGDRPDQHLRRHGGSGVRGRGAPPVRGRAARHAADRPRRGGGGRGSGHGRHHRGAPVRSDGRRRRPDSRGPTAWSGLDRGRRAGAWRPAARTACRQRSATRRPSASIRARTWARWAMAVRSSPGIPSSLPGSGGARIMAEPPRDRHRHDQRGRNSRLDTLQAAMLVGQARRPGQRERSHAAGRWTGIVDSSRRRSGRSRRIPPPNPFTTSRWSASRTAPQ